MMKFLKRIGMIILGLILLLLIATFLVVNIAPQFGKTYDSKKKAEFEKLDNYQDGGFVNTITTKMELQYWDLLKKQFKKDPKRNPSKDILPISLDSLDIENRKDSGDYLSWLGHSAFLMELDGKRILLDPMLGPSPAPFEFLGPSRYSSELAIEIEKLPSIDLLIISHDHYDHLDYPSIVKLRDKVEAFYVPLGVGTHLEHWGVDPKKIKEFNWWEDHNYKDLQISFAPSRHFSGRALMDRDKTLWGSWIIRSKNQNIYFSGDGGYGDHFKEIGKKYGPFDLSLMECGQYNEQWKAIHLMPEETAIAAKELSSKVFMPIHWGAFTLALHPWNEPVEVAKKKAQEIGQKIITPRIGESFDLNSNELPISEWWKAY